MDPKVSVFRLKHGSLDLISKLNLVLIARSNRRVRANEHLGVQLGQMTHGEENLRTV